jgi:hypothetical protein
VTQQNKLLFVFMVLGDLILILTWTLRETGSAPVPMIRFVEETDPNPVGAASAGTTEPRASVRPASDRSVPELAPVSARERSHVVAPKRVRLQGTIYGLADHPLILPELEITARNDAGEVFTTRLGMRPDYFLSNLHAGRWTIVTHDEDHYDTQTIVELRAEEKVHPLDLVLQATDELRVRMLTPDGTSLAQALETAGLHVGVIAVATSELPKGTLPGGTGLEVSISPNHHYRSPASHTEAMNGSGSDVQGVLSLHEPSLSFVSAVVGDRVLRTRPLIPRQPEITFSISAEEVRALLVSVRLTLIDVQSGEAVANARVMLEGTTLESDENGVVEFERVLPGTRRISVLGRNYKEFSRQMHLDAGGKKDLGTWQLEAIRPRQPR